MDVTQACGNQLPLLLDLYFLDFIFIARATRRACDIDW